ncbi:hypothetical protein BV898_19827 [Hypsibius exemplaris]|uniref:Uncharacterized protein n=1 Tax=Hypsibius exemplaris TaxID=2072580 RepID=A0A9X6NJM7_HYPEX|nr:hypothetical protein BV898_19827 [Hypsibius exemplaris]
MRVVVIPFHGAPLPRPQFGSAEIRSRPCVPLGKPVPLFSPLTTQLCANPAHNSELRLPQLSGAFRTAYLGQLIVPNKLREITPRPHQSLHLLRVVLADAHVLGSLYSEATSN